MTVNSAEPRYTAVVAQVQSELLPWLDEQARRNYTSRAAIIRKALAVYRQNTEEPESGLGLGSTAAQSGGTPGGGS